MHIVNKGNILVVANYRYSMPPFGRPRHAGLRFSRAAPIAGRYLPLDDVNTDSHWHGRKRLIPMTLDDDNHHNKQNLEYRLQVPTSDQNEPSL